MSFVTYFYYKIILFRGNLVSLLLDDNISQAGHTLCQRFCTESDVVAGYINSILH